jgi:hypothetical protein
MRGAGMMKRFFAVSALTMFATGYLWFYAHYQIIRRPQQHFFEGCNFEIHNYPDGFSFLVNPKTQLAYPFSDDSEATDFLESHWVTMCGIWPGQ